MFMKLGVVSLSLGFIDFPDILDFIKEIGGETLELSTADGVHNNTLKFDSECRSSIVESINARGMSIASVAGYSDFTSPDADERQSQVDKVGWYCQLASDLGVKLVRVMGGSPRESLTHHEMVENIISGFRMAVKIADEHDVILALENHGPVVNDGPTVVKIIESVGSPNLRVTLDTGNYCWAGHSVEEAMGYFKQVAPYAANVHLKDLVFAKDGEAKFVPLGEGLIDLKAVIHILSGVGYDGALLCEYEGKGDPRVLIKQGVFNQEEYVEELRSGTQRSLAHLKSILNSR